MKTTLPEKQQRSPSVNRVHERDWDDLFDDLFSPFGLIRRETDIFRPSEGFLPRVDVTEENAEIKVTAELPGLDEKAVKVELEEDSLILSGEKKEEHEEKTRSGYRKERRYGSFRREIRLPARAQAEKARAEFKNGVLTVTIPKAEESRRHVEIKVE
jgi:HSP20 family protein